MTIKWEREIEEYDGELLANYTGTDDKGNIIRLYEGLSLYPKENASEPTWSYSLTPSEDSSDRAMIWNPFICWSGYEESYEAAKEKATSLLSYLESTKISNPR